MEGSLTRGVAALLRLDQEFHSWEVEADGAPFRPRRASKVASKADGERAR